MKRIIYLDNAATSFPKPRSVVSAIDRTVLRYCANPGRSSHPLALRAAEEVYGCRKRLATLFGGSEENVVFTLNATHAINLSLKATLKRGDHVLISDIEHNALLRPVAELAARGLITYGLFRSESDPERLTRELESRLQPNTALICACHHSNICNLCLPARDIGRFCRSRGLLFLLDASQSAGSVPINIENDCIDILCAPAHKGLYGIPGCGFAIFGSRLADGKRLSTFVEGGNGVSSESPYMPDFLPERLEAGTLPLPAISALSEGVRLVRRLGIPRIAEHERRLCAYARRLLSEIDRIQIHSQTDGSILLFSVRGIESEDMASLLSQYGICVRAGLHCAPLAHRWLGTPADGAVRVSFGIFNTPADVLHLASACRRIVKKEPFGATIKSK